MNMKHVVTVGVLAMVMATGMVTAPASFAEGNQGEGMARIGHGGSTYPANAKNDCQMKADKVERIGQGGSTYALNQVDGTVACSVAREGPKHVDVIERIGAGGSTYSFSKSTVQTAGR